MINSCNIDSWRNKSAVRAAEWLKGLRNINGQLRIEQKLGLLLCECIVARQNLPFPSPEDMALGEPIQLIFLERGDLQHLLRSEMRKVNIARFETDASMTGEGSTCHSVSHCDRLDESLLTLVLGGLALAYAAEGDPLTVSLLLAMSSGLKLRSQWLAEAELYLLYQQHPAGYFGFFGKELALLNDERSDLKTRLLLTVSVLWSLAASNSV